MFAYCAICTFFIKDYSKTFVFSTSKIFHNCCLVDTKAISKVVDEIEIE